MGEIISKCISGIINLIAMAFQFLFSLFYTDERLNIFGYIAIAFLFLLILDLVVTAVINLIFGGEKNENN